MHASPAKPNQAHQPAKPDFRPGRILATSGSATACMNGGRRFLGRTLSFVASARLGTTLSVVASARLGTTLSVVA